MTWQPIDTAPKDGSRVLLWVPDEAGSSYTTQIGTWTFYSATSDDFLWVYDGHSDGLRRYCMAHPPTHWMPLPEPPS
jgi:Protein of unknown function (DUF551)